MSWSRRRASANCLVALFLYLPRICKGEYVARYPFLYATETDKDAFYPVIEHLSPTFRGDTLTVDDRPDFLYATTGQGYRIVEYYLHWCNTCQLFAVVYRSFAVKIQELAAQQGVHIDVYAVSCSPNRKLCVDQAVKGFPKIRLYPPSSNTTHTDATITNGTLPFIELAHHTHLHPLTVLEQLGIDFDGHDEEWDIESAGAGNMARAVEAVAPTWWHQAVAVVSGPWTRNEQASPTIYRRTRDDVKADIHLSFDYALRYEVYTSSGPLSDEQRRVLRDWLELLVRTLPATWTLNKLIQELINNFVYVAQSEDYLVAVLEEYPAPTERWSTSCSHGRPDIGYTCGLWQLFHAMTVGLVDYNRAAFDPEKMLVTEGAARTLRDYVDLFFGCDTCRHHFVMTFDACGHERCYRLSDYVIEDENEWMELPLWLSRTHNAVNVRLQEEKAAREHRVVTPEDSLAVQWPPRRECGACWTNRTDEEELDGRTVTTISTVWNVDLVYKYLRLEYGQRDAHTAELRRELLPELDSDTVASYTIGVDNDTSLQPASTMRLVYASRFVCIMAAAWYMWRRARPAKKERID